MHLISYCSYSRVDVMPWRGVVSEIPGSFRASSGLCSGYSSALAGHTPV